MISERLQPHTLNVVSPVMTDDGYGNLAADFGNTAPRRRIRGFVQQNQRAEPFTDGRAPLVGIWLLITNDPGVTGSDQIEWLTPDLTAVACTFTVDGPPEPVYSTTGGYHHLEATLRIVEG